MLEQATYRRLKGALTRAQNSGDPLKVLKTCVEAAGIFERQGHPDSWHRWANATDDALREINERLWSLRH